MAEPIDVTDPAIAYRVVEIQRAAYAVEAALIGFDGIPPMHETAAEVTARTDLAWIGSHVDDLLVGITAWSATDEILNINRMAVHPDFARTGHGSALLNAIPTTQTMTVSTGAQNGPARAFYERHGFNWVGDQEVVPGLLISNYERQGD